ncbi:MAG: phosphatase PAP2 family protein [Actinomycetaceae bacterium]|nr:phosphatase PAP2 family protein [Actinomycetaceae bacterium]
MVTSVCAFFALTVVALRSFTGQALDDIVLTTLRVGHRQVLPLTDLLRTGVSELSVGVTIIAVMAVAAARRRFALAMRMGVMIAGANITTQLLKRWILDRPYLGVGLDLSNSFPSGHATVLVSVALAVVIVVSQRLRSKVAAVVSAGTALALIVIIISGWHRPSDIVGAILISLAWAMTLAPQEEPVQAEDPINTRMLVVSLSAISMSVVAVAVLWSRLQALANSVYASGSVNAAIEAHTALSFGFSLVSVVFIVGLAVLAINLIVYLQSGRRRH